MRRILTGMMVTLLVLVAPRLASAQAKQGDKEIQVGGNVFSLVSSDFTMTSGQFNFGLGYFMSDRVEIGVSPIVTISSTQIPATYDSRGRVTSAASTTLDGDMGLSTSLQVFLGAQSSKVKPYLGGTFIINSFKTEEGASLADNTFVGGTLGIKNYFSEKAALDMKGSYGFRPNAPGDFQIIQFNIGITYLF